MAVWWTPQEEYQSVMLISHYLMLLLAQLGNDRGVENEDEDKVVDDHKKSSNRILGPEFRYPVTTKHRVSPAKSS